MRTLLRISAALVIVLALSLGAFALASKQKLSRQFAIQDSAPTIPADSASIARGRYLVRAVAKCVDCHGENMAGKLFIDAGPLGKVWSANLSGGHGSVRDSLTPEQWSTAVRHGVGRPGRPLMVMPATSFNAMSDEDLGAIVAYLRTVPPVDFVPERSFLRPLGWVLYTTGKLPTLTEADLISHTERRAPAPPPSVTVEYGRYLATIGGCNGCHGPTFSGGPIPGMPPDAKPAANLTPAGIGHYTEADFFRALREGKRPSGTAIDSLMPWRYTREMTDDDIRAVYAFLKTLPPRDFGNR
ncbi:MAG: c-type cytochrome [Gemmatimonadaceae bacterium]